MPITNVTVVSEGPGNKVVLEWTDQTARTWREEYINRQPTTQDLINVRQAQLEDRTLRNWEIKDAEQALRRKEAPKEVADHQPQADYDRRVLVQLMKQTDINVLIAALPWWVAHQARAGNNDVQRAAFLGVPTAEYQDISARMGDVQGVAGGVDTVNAQVWNGRPSDAWR